MSSALQKEQLQTRDRKLADIDQQLGEKVTVFMDASKIFSS